MRVRWRTKILEQQRTIATTAPAIETVHVPHISTVMVEPSTHPAAAATTAAADSGVAASFLRRRRRPVDSNATSDEVPVGGALRDAMIRALGQQQDRANRPTAVMGQPPPPPTIREQRRHHRHHHHHGQRRQMSSSQSYCVLSAVVAFLAIVTSPSPFFLARDRPSTMSVSVSDDSLAAAMTAAGTNATRSGQSSNTSGVQADPEEDKSMFRSPRDGQTVTHEQGVTHEQEDVTAPEQKIVSSSCSTAEEVSGHDNHKAIVPTDQYPSNSTLSGSNGNNNSNSYTFSNMLWNNIIYLDDFIRRKLQTQLPSRQKQQRHQQEEYNKDGVHSLDSKSQQHQRQQYKGRTFQRHISKGKQKQQLLSKEGIKMKENKQSHSNRNNESHQSSQQLEKQDEQNSIHFLKKVGRTNKMTIFYSFFFQNKLFLLFQRCSKLFQVLICNLIDPILLQFVSSVITSNRQSCSIIDAGDNTTCTVMKRHWLWSWLPTRRSSIGKLNSTDFSNNNETTITPTPAKSTPNGNDKEGIHEKITIGQVAITLIDKIMTSTPRLMAVTNFMLSITYWIHSIIAGFFLVDAVYNGNGHGRGGIGRRRGAGGGGVGNQQHQQQRNRPGIGAAMGQQQHHQQQQRDARLGGYLIFKLLLLSAVLSPDTLDMLILLSWYTLLGFLRSLGQLSNVTITHYGQSGLSFRDNTAPGTIHLLALVLCCNIGSVLGCMKLFLGAGYGMVFLLVMDGLILIVDVVGYIGRYWLQVLEECHLERTSKLEERQLLLHNQVLAGLMMMNDGSTTGLEDERFNSGVNGNDDHVTATGDNGALTASDHVGATADDSVLEIDRAIEMLESKHTRYTALLASIIFFIEVISAVLTAFHFCHIWYLHGLGFGLVDAVLALHLHSSVAALRRKVSERRAIRKIERALDGLFEDAPESELRKAHANGDMCSVCLRPMMSANVKKLLCNHLYHSSCLMEVVERARSIEAARCPLCRALMVESSGQQGATTAPGTAAAGNGRTETNTENADGAAGNNGARDGGRRIGIQGDSLFRFSTEGFLPTWLPIPAFSFEVVRRPPNTFNANNNGQGTAQRQQPVGATTNNANDVLHQNPVQNRPQEDAARRHNGENTSFLLRFLQLVGVAPLSPEEEEAALVQLMEMFPQFERSDLQRELRLRGSAELVAESILMGRFEGLARINAEDLTI